MPPEKERGRTAPNINQAEEGQGAHIFKPGGPRYRLTAFPLRGPPAAARTPPAPSEGPPLITTVRHRPRSPTVLYRLQREVPLYRRQRPDPWAIRNPRLLLHEDFSLFSQFVLRPPQRHLCDAFILGRFHHDRR